MKPMTVWCRTTLAILFALWTSLRDTSAITLDECIVATLRNSPDAVSYTHLTLPTIYSV